MKITEDIRYIGVDDHEIDLFEGQFIAPLGMAYNSYVIMDEKVAVMDTVDVHFKDQWLANLQAALGDRRPDYLVIHHMEPDHSAGIGAFVQAYPEARLIGSTQALKMLDQFFPGLAAEKKAAANNEKLSLGKHELTFIPAPMVHWPEVMFSYDSYDKVLFSADAFGKFGANDVEDPEGWDCEARRYYFGIVGKYGAQTQAVLKKLAGLAIEKICPLHGPVLAEDLSYYLAKYNTWSSYEPEEDGVFIAAASVYGHTMEAAELLAAELEAKGVAVKLSDLAREDIYECVENAFRYSRLVLASVTYNADMFPAMKHFLQLLQERGYQKRTVAFIENGTWAPTAAKAMQNMLASGKDLTFAGPAVSIRSALTEETKEKIRELAQSL